MQPQRNCAEYLKALRRRKGVGLKRAAPELGVSYTYLSKIENSRSNPSAELLERMAKYYDADKDELLVLADRIPEDIQAILRENPREALDFLRRRFSNASIAPERPTRAAH